ncbi:MAG: hypothetical protein CL457_05535 [Acidimicrobiaceae bacterium]|nr:hypothetical protein [Acidimicrobiaceae bacterium]
MSDELEEGKDALDDDELQEDFGDDMPEDEELEGSEDGDIFDEDDEIFDDDDDSDDDEFDDDDDDDKGPATTDAISDDEDDDDEVEADLTAILENRIKANDDENPEDGESAKSADGEDANVVAKQEDEMNCPSCFLLVSKAAIEKDGECPHCGAVIKWP